MPELPEIEAYRRLADTAARGRRVERVFAPDLWFLKRGLTPEAAVEALTGVTLGRSRRTGKLLLIDTDGPTLGLRFGMTGRLLVDGSAGIDRLQYASGRDEPAWDRFGLDFADGGTLRLRDPRRLGGVELDPDERRLGPDALAVAPAALRRAMAGSAAPLKARLMDQHRLAGIGNLMADEVLWRAGLSPLRSAGSLTPAEARRLHRHLVATVDDLIVRGGSHLGDLTAHRAPGGHCPRDGAALVTAQVGGRTTWWCARHQR